MGAVPRRTAPGLHILDVDVALSDVLKLLCFKESDLAGKYFVEGLFASLCRGVFVGSHPSDYMDRHAFDKLAEIGGILAVP